MSFIQGQIETHINQAIKVAVSHLQDDLENDQQLLEMVKTLCICEFDNIMELENQAKNSLEKDSFDNFQTIYIYFKDPMQAFQVLRPRSESDKIEIIYACQKQLFESLKEFFKQSNCEDDHEKWINDTHRLLTDKHQQLPTNEIIPANHEVAWFNFLHFGTRLILALAGILLIKQINDFFTYAKNPSKEDDLLNNFAVKSTLILLLSTYVLFRAIPLIQLDARFALDALQAFREAIVPHVENREVRARSPI